MVHTAARHLRSNKLRNRRVGRLSPSDYRAFAAMRPPHVNRPQDRLGDSQVCRSNPPAARLRSRPAVEGRFSIRHIGDIAAFDKELHNFLAGSGQFRPPRFRVGILLQTSNLAFIENEINLSQSGLRGSPNGILFFASLDSRGMLDESLTPDFNQRVLE